MVVFDPSKWNCFVALNIIPLFLFLIKLTGIEKQTKQNKTKHKTDNENENKENLPELLFIFGDYCIECMLRYLTPEDIKSILGRAIMRPLAKATNFHHKRYLLEAALQIALRRSKHVTEFIKQRNHGLTEEMLRILLRVPLKEKTEESKAIDLHSICQLLLQTLLLPLYKSFHPKESLMTLQSDEFYHSLKTENPHRPTFVIADSNQRSWIYAVIYQQLQNETYPTSLLFSFALTLTIVMYRYAGASLFFFVCVFFVVFCDLCACVMSE